MFSHDVDQEREGAGRGGVVIIGLLFTMQTAQNICLQLLHNIHIQ